jgi:hypothetical protein
MPGFSLLSGIHDAEGSFRNTNQRDCEGLRVGISQIQAFGGSDFIDPPCPGIYSFFAESGRYTSNCRRMLS